MLRLAAQGLATTHGSSAVSEHLAWWHAWLCAALLAGTLMITPCSLTVRPRLPRLHSYISIHAAGKVPSPSPPPCPPIPCRPHVTLISGTNGSGKSAVLQALQVCLGASARSTGRSASLGNFIRTGAHEARVQVTLWNTCEGPLGRGGFLFGLECLVLHKSI